MVLCRKGYSGAPGGPCNMALSISPGATGISGLLKEGTRTLQGAEEALGRNISAVRALADVVRTSFGPAGLHKLVVNGLDKVFLTNDAGCIVREMEIEHPAARMVLLASEQQSREYGDGTALVILFAAELLAEAEELLRIGLKPAAIVEGYEVALRNVFGDGSLFDGGDAFGPESGAPDAPSKSGALSPAVSPLDAAWRDAWAALRNDAVRAVLSAKQHGREEALLALVLDALRHAGVDGAPSPAADGVALRAASDMLAESVRVIKVLGGGLHLSRAFAGLVLEREPAGRVRAVSDARIAVFACPINVSRTETKGTVLLTDAAQLRAFSADEEARLAAQLAGVTAAANVVVAGDGVGDAAMHVLERAGVLVIKMPSKFDLRRVCRATGATPLARLGSPTPEELGRAAAVRTVDVGGTLCTLVEQAPDSAHCRLATIVLRSNTASQLDDVDRAVAAALAAARTCVREPLRAVHGGGAFETGLSGRVAQLADTTPGLAQHALRAYASALDAAARQLAVSSGQDAADVLARLHAAHARGDASARIDVDADAIASVAAGADVIPDLYSVKRSALRLATEAAVTLLRVDQIVMARLATGPKARPAGPQDADDDMA